jgi:hypothetical protein
MACVNQHDLGTAETYQQCELIASENHEQCAFNPTIVNYANDGTGRCQCAPPENVPCQRKQVSANFDLHVLAGQVFQGAMMGGQNGEMTGEMSAAQAQLVGVIGDPFTTDKDGKSVQFWLPLEKDSHLLTCENVQLQGHAMPSGVAGDHQQWFDRFQVHIGGSEMLKVEVAPANATMSVAVQGTRLTQGATVVKDGYQLDFAQDLKTARFATGNVAMGFAASTGTKGKPHLDLRFEKLDTKTCSAGVLPEIWGVVPMSKETTAMLKAPEQ